MNIQIDINGSIKRTIDSVTKFGTFWKDHEFPDNPGPAVSHMLVISLLPAAGSLIAAILTWLAMVIKGIPGYGILWFLGSIIFYPVLMYALYVIMPVVLGMMIAAIAPNMSIQKGDANAFATILAYSASPGAAAGFASAIIMGVFTFLFVLIGAWGLFGLFALITGIIGLAGGIISLILVYNGFNTGLDIESGQSIILIVIAAVATLIVWAILFGIIAAIFGIGFMGGMYGWNPYGRF